MVSEFGSRVGIFTLVLKIKEKLSVEFKGSLEFLKICPLRSFVERLTKCLILLR